MPRIRLATTAVVLGTVAALGGCTSGPDPVAPGSASLVRPATPSCAATVHNTRWASVARTRVATAASVVTVTDSPAAATLVRVAGLPGTIRPELARASGPRVGLRSLVHALSASMPVQQQPGPRFPDTGDWLIEKPAAGTYVWYAGADQVQASYVVRCRSGRATGWLSTWMAPTSGGLACGTVPPAGSVGARVARFCPRGAPSPAAPLSR